MAERLMVLMLVLAAVLLVVGCAYAQPDPEEARRRMVEEQIRSRGVQAPRVLEAMLEVPRHEFVLPADVDRAYADGPLPIGHGQTISQPYIVALMTELADPDPDERALEIGTGSGYQAAVLSRLVSHVYTIELVEPLAEAAADTLGRLGYDNITVRAGDGYRGWPDEAPFDLIVVTAAPDAVPPALVDQLAVGGRMVVPVGAQHEVQELRLLEKRPDGSLETRYVLEVRFVPMVRGRANPMQ